MFRFLCLCCVILQPEIQMNNDVRIKELFPKLMTANTTNLIDANNILPE